MPLYSYRCTGCDATFEALVRSSETPVCPSCGSEQLQRLLSMPAAEGKSGELVKRARAAAGAAGHLSNFRKG
ncbi:MAG: zinc ribbon domain-containing protein [Rhodospirillaceae bacterium]|nr:zinc ribbon domain-containing protein [Rhodospirillales bacterium]